MTLLDSHCHIGEPEYDADRDAVVARAREAGVAEMIVVGAGGTLETNERALRAAETIEGCRAVVGIHPHDAAAVDDALFERIAALARHPRVVGIGETGLDFHYDRSPRDRQAAEFRRFVRLARERDLPLVVHSRAAADETLAILREEDPGPAVLHCFTYGPDVARRAAELGLYVSFSGIVTFRKAGDVREAARIVPRDRILVETDCPYLSPEPKRGGRNEPARVRDVAAGLARALDLPLDEVAALTRDNARRFFRLDEPAAG